MPGPELAPLRPRGEAPPTAVCAPRMVKGLPQRPHLGQGYRAPLSAKVFSSWDFCIRGWEAATIKNHEISNEFKVCARGSPSGKQRAGEARVCVRAV